MIFCPENICRGPIYFCLNNDFCLGEEQMCWEKEKTAFSAFPTTFCNKVFNKFLLHSFYSHKELTVSQTSPFTRSLKTLWEKEKLLLTSNFFYSQIIFYPFQGPSAISIKFEIFTCKLLVLKSLKFVVWGRVLNLSFWKEFNIIFSIIQFVICKCFYVGGWLKSLVFGKALKAILTINKVKFHCTF